MVGGGGRGWWVASGEWYVRRHVACNTHTQVRDMQYSYVACGGVSVTVVQYTVRDQLEIIK